MKAKLALFEASPPTCQSSKPFKSKNKGLVAETFDLDEKEVFDDEEEKRVQVLMALADDELFVGKNHARNDNPFVPASLNYNHEMVPKSKDRVKRLNPNIKLLNFNNGRILVLKSEAVNECLQLTKGSFDLESSKESVLKSQNPLPLWKNLQEASPSSEVMTLTYQDHSLRKRSSLGIMKHTVGILDMMIQKSNRMKQKD
uniref:Retrovirus-related Pol polyprotein from transposon TNT 1-94 n=1 Tax=Tanacetum cinerariifolium TaxID=118510 RepID=A0A699H9V7_TANCI|nr:retrovirus-related Pol polyprotein from transposon TNT 1-94 [Tanacetum cinerariifolium]